MRGMEIIPVPAFQDNYIWALRSGHDAVVVDPGEAAPVRAWLAAEGCRLRAILLTHHHMDHVGGVPELLAESRVPVYGPATPAIAGLDHPVREGDRIALPGFELELAVLEVPGHTASHLAYLGPDCVFCGDTLFSAGCGRIFDGTAAQLHASLVRLAALPPETRVFCTHEYTLSNLAFSRAVEPVNPERDRWHEECEAMRASDLPTLPTSIARERAINPFLRLDAPGVQASLTAHAGIRPGEALQAFTALRAWKDVFRA